MHGLNNFNKIFKYKQTTIIQKFWYNDLINMENTQMCRFGYYCWKQM